MSSDIHEIRVVPLEGIRSGKVLDKKLNEHLV